MLKKIGFITLNIIVLIILTLIFLKLISFLPTQKLQPLIADKLIFLQNIERNIENFLNNVSLTYHQISSKKELEEKYKMLYQKRITEQGLNNALLFENKILRNKLGFIKNYEYQLLPADIISRSADNWFNFIIINRGSNAGVQKDMEVICEQGLIGYVYSVFADSAKVLLLTDPLVQISCINKRNLEIGILSGQLNKPLQLSYIGSNSDIQEGDLLLTSGQSLRYRKGLPVATVTKISTTRNNYYKLVQAEPLANLCKIDTIFIIK